MSFLLADISENTVLSVLSCVGNQIESLDISNNTSLTQLFCSNNQLTNLDVSKNTALEELHCSANQLSSLDISDTNINSADVQCDNKIVAVELDARNTLDLAVLPGFDVTKASDFNGGSKIVRNRFKMS